MLFVSASMSEVVEPAMRDTLSAVWGCRNVVLGPRSSVRGPWSYGLGSGKVAGKVLIVDQYAEHANMLILLETVLKWCCV
jgi:hypothetical protein